MKRSGGATMRSLVTSTACRGGGGGGDDGCGCAPAHCAAAIDAFLKLSARGCAAAVQSPLATTLRENSTHEAKRRLKVRGTPYKQWDGAKRLNETRCHSRAPPHLSLRHAAAQQHTPMLPYRQRFRPRYTEHDSRQRRPMGAPAVAAVVPIKFGGTD